MASLLLLALGVAAAVCFVYPSTRALGVVLAVVLCLFRPELFVLLLLVLCAGDLFYFHRR